MFQKLLGGNFLINYFHFVCFIIIIILFPSVIYHIFSFIFMSF